MPFLCTASVRTRRLRRSCSSRRQSLRRRTWTCLHHGLTSPCSTMNEAHAASLMHMPASSAGPCTGGAAATHILLTHFTQRHRYLRRWPAGRCSRIARMLTCTIDERYAMSRPAPRRLRPPFVSSVDRARRRRGRPSRKRRSTTRSPARAQLRRNTRSPAPVPPHARRLRSATLAPHRATPVCARSSRPRRPRP